MKKPVKGEKNKQNTIPGKKEQRGETKTDKAMKHRWEEPKEILIEVGTENTERTRSKWRWGAEEREMAKGELNAEESIEQWLEIMDFGDTLFRFKHQLYLLLTVHSWGSYFLSFSHHWLGIITVSVCLQNHCKMLGHGEHTIWAFVFITVYEPL